VQTPPDTPPRSLAELRRLTPARVALGRRGASLPTAELLDFTLAHARARDAVDAAFDVGRLSAALAELCGVAFEFCSLARDRREYLARPDLGRKLADSTREDLMREQRPHGLDADPLPRDALDAVSASRDVVLVVGDGLSPTAVNTQAVAVIERLLPRFAAAGITVGPGVVVRNARVAIGDEIGAALGARMVVMLIGERPGLSTPASLGAYLTFGPRPGLTDAARNCVSNIHPTGLSPDEAAHKIAWLVGAGLARQQTGVMLKDESGDAAALADASRP